VAQGSSTVELEFWKSAERLGTRSSYEAYLGAFPQGLFAPLARAALEKDVRDRSTSGVVPGVDRGRLDEPQKYVSRRPADSGAVEFSIGDEFTGPGILTIGWAGSKKQMVLPSGRWVVLAAADDKVNQAQPGFKENRVDLTRAVFGRFEQGRLITLLRFTVSSKRATVPAWSDIDLCDDGGPLRLGHSRSGSWLEECASARVVTEPLSVPLVWKDTTVKSLLGPAATRSSLGIVSTLTFSERKLGYLGVTRIDWPEPALAGTAADWRNDVTVRQPARQAFVDKLLAWCSQYKILAAEGFRKGIDADDLVPGMSGHPVSALVLADFAP
jgi:hypothetical protein